MKKAVIAAAALLCAAAFTGVPAFAESVPDGLWGARLWLTSQAFGLKEDCPVQVLFRSPVFRTMGATTSRLVESRAQGDDLFLTVDTTRGSDLVERVTLQLRWQHAEGIASVESISLGGAAEADRQTLSYKTAVDDDEEYDVYTDTLMSLYQTYFDPATVRKRAAASPH
ncbi:MAG TPA: hypothetical protein VMV03_04250 [Spirochaetia bacterium]|nr:hypothetical protein [Spirochaetia bacterium]